MSVPAVTIPTGRRAPRGFAGERAIRDALSIAGRNIIAYRRVPQLLVGASVLSAFALVLLLR